MATNFSPCKGSYFLNQFPSNVMFGMKGFHISASGAIQGHHGPLVKRITKLSFGKKKSDILVIYPELNMSRYKCYNNYSSYLKV